MYWRVLYARVRHVCERTWPVVIVKGCSAAAGAEPRHRSHIWPYVLWNRGVRANRRGSLLQAGGVETRGEKPLRRTTACMNSSIQRSGLIDDWRSHVLAWWFEPWTSIQGFESRGVHNNFRCLDRFLEYIEKYPVINCLWRWNTKE